MAYQTIDTVTNQPIVPMNVMNVPSFLVVANGTANTDTTTALLASANYTGATRDMGASYQGYNRIRVTVMATAGMGHGHLALEQSTDAFTTPRETGRYPVPSDGTYYTFEFPITMRYVRIRFYNGAIAQTSLFIASVLVREDGGIDYMMSPTFQHSTTALAASGGFTGVSLNLSTMNPFNKHRAVAYSDQAGTMYLEQSRDNVNWRTTSQVAVSAATPTVLEDLLVYQYCRVRFANGATAQTTFELVSTLLSF